MSHPIATAKIETHRSSIVLDWNEFIEKLLFSQKAKFPIFDNENDPKVRAVFVVAIGCVMWPRGIKCCGPSNIKKYLDELTSSDNNQVIFLVKNLLKTYKTCTVNNKNMICCFADALHYITINQPYMDIFMARIPTLLSPN